MQISVSQVQGNVPITIFELDGLLNMGTSDQLEKKGNEAYDSGSRYLLLDFTRVTSLTSAGLRSLLKVARLFSQGTGTAVNSGSDSKNRHLKVLNPDPQIESVLAVSGFTGFLEIYKDRQEAIDSFN